MESKACSHCFMEKPVNAFGLDYSRRSGRNPACKECRAYAYRQKVDKLRKVGWFLCDQCIQWRSRRMTNGIRINCVRLGREEYCMKCAREMKLCI